MNANPIAKTRQRGVRRTALGTDANGFFNLLTKFRGQTTIPFFVTVKTNVVRPLFFPLSVHPV